MTIRPRPFGIHDDGTPVEAVDLAGDGISLTVITLGATIASLRSPDRKGAMGEVVLDFDSLEAKAQRPPYCGASIGRYANRIAGGRFDLDGTTFTLPRNEEPNGLHGGPLGFHGRMWTITETGDARDPFVTMQLDCPDGQDGFPGHLVATARYALTGPGELTIAYTATSDRPTVVNMTNHAYFNLTGDDHNTIVDHRVRIAAGEVLPIDATRIPTGELQPVEGTQFDFRTSKTFADRIRGTSDPQLLQERGFDHTYVLVDRANELQFAARVQDDTSGRSLTILTTEPGLQLYSGALLEEAAGRPPDVIRQSTGFCMEPQRFPDAPNRPDFPSARLDPGDTCRQVSVYQLKTT
ncbi:aldose 1-epimerase [Amorphus suaedae]